MAYVYIILLIVISDVTGGNLATFIDLCQALDDFLQ